MSVTRAPTHINLSDKLGEFSEHWSPKIVARYNDNEVRLVKTDGEFVWHKHDETDELFLILEGEFDMDFRDRTVTVKAGELLIVPKGTEHRLAARIALVDYALQVGIAGMVAIDIAIGIAIAY